MADVAWMAVLCALMAHEKTRPDSWRGASRLQRAPCRCGAAVIAGAAAAMMNVAAEF